MEHGYRSTLTLADVTTQKMLHRIYKGNQKNKKQKKPSLKSIRCNTVVINKTEVNQASQSERKRVEVRWD